MFFYFTFRDALRMIGERFLLMPLSTTILLTLLPFMMLIEGIRTQQEKHLNRQRDAFEEAYTRKQAAKKVKLEVVS